MGALHQCYGAINRPWDGIRAWGLHGVLGCCGNGCVGALFYRSVIFINVLAMPGTTGGAERAAKSVRDSGLGFLEDQVKKLDGSATVCMESHQQVHSDDQMFGIEPFFVEKGWRIFLDRRFYAHNLLQVRSQCLRCSMPLTHPPRPRTLPAYSEPCSCHVRSSWKDPLALGKPVWWPL